MDTYSLSDVFSESEIPVLTFVKPKEFNDLVGSIKTQGKHITLSGPSGCGKTTLAKKALDRAGFGTGHIHWMSGRDHVSDRTIGELFAKEFSCSEDEKEIIGNLQMAGLVIIDDFHHLQESLRNSIGFSLKRWH
jgi:ABC-type cobalamin/Fe3+-siderophores transport system ATPase subunit